MNRTEELVYWITEREQMRVRREPTGGKTPAPAGTWKYGWSDDVFMGCVRYCNVRREDDKVTRWLADYWRPHHAAVWETVLARMVNYIPTLVELSSAAVWDGGLSSVSHYMKERRRRGEKLWTSAYTISTCGKPMDKVDYVLGVVESVKAYEEFYLMSWDNPLKPGTLAKAHEELLKFDGLGSFLAAQVVADLKNMTWHPLHRAEDWRWWSAPGPGSLRGLSEYFNAKITPKQYSTAILQCWREVEPYLPQPLRDLHMQDFQNCLCEFSKYMRFKRGGHVRNKYST